MTHPYNSYDYDPPAPVIPIIVSTTDDNTKQIKTEALVDTGADITCLPRALIDALGAECASSRNVSGINGVSLGHVDSYFLEFEIAATRKLVEVIALGHELLLGRNLLNQFELQLHGPDQKLDIAPNKI